MARLGKVYDNLMVDVKVSNIKLQARAERLVGRLTGLDLPAARTLLETAGGSVKRAAVMHHAGVDATKADQLLAASAGALRPWIEKETSMDPVKPTGVTVSNLREALKFLLEDDNMIDRMEAEALVGLIQQDGRVTDEEKAFLNEAIAHSNFDERALNLLKAVLEKN
jgi:hypothetical protein